MEYFSDNRKLNNLFHYGSKMPFKLSRSKIDLFLECPHCFYLDRKLGISRPPGFPFNLNSAVDALLKKEFDFYRNSRKPHPLMEKARIKAVPFKHPKIEEWRSNFSGIRFLYPYTNFLIYGAVDDIWINQNNELIVVDYKATSKDGEVNLDSDWQIAYKRQMEIYQWLFRKNGFKVFPVGYFVYANGKKDKESFNARLEFDIKIIPYQGDDSWIEGTINDIFKCLMAKKPPASSPECLFCKYVEAIKGTGEEKKKKIQELKKEIIEREEKIGGEKNQLSFED
ncbi:MAG: PD-(D/E)XK nuclease family protein [Candidatus Paceibacterota bacterium]|jgi:hypothetical protein